MAIQITLSGGSPWGFKMTGGKDFHMPLAIGKVTAGGKAAKAGVVQGYIIEKVNGEEFSNLSHHAAQNKIKNAGFSLSLTLSKPKPRETPPDLVTSNTPAPKASEYKPDPARTERYNNPGKWQKEGGVTQSPAYFAKTRSSSRAQPTYDEDTENALSITPEIKQMIEEEEELARNKPPEPVAKPLEPVAKPPEPAAAKPWEPHTTTSSMSPPASSAQPSTNGTNLDKSKAASNIGKFFQSSSAPRYGEPDFARHLQDIARPLGDPLVLEIRLAPVLPVPTVHWYHNNKPTRESKEKDIRFLNNGPIHTLVLGELTPDLLGTYTCTIMNKNGSKSTRCQVSVEGGQGKHHSNYGVAAVHPPTTTTSDGRRVVPSTSFGLYSNKTAQESYHGQVNRKASRDSNEESEVLKALREEAPQKNHYKTPSMKYLADSLLPESDDL